MMLQLETNLPWRTGLEFQITLINYVVKTTSEEIQEVQYFYTEVGIFTYG